MTRPKLSTRGLRLAAISSQPQCSCIRILYRRPKRCGSFMLPDIFGIAPSRSCHRWHRLPRWPLDLYSPNPISTSVEPWSLAVSGATAEFLVKPLEAFSASWVVKPSLQHTWSSGLTLVVPSIKLFTEGPLTGIAWWILPCEDFKLSARTHKAIIESALYLGI